MAYVYVLLLLWLCWAGFASASDEEIRLIHDLFERNGYNPLIRPVRNITESLTINFEVALSQIVLVDERNQIMKTNVWLQLYWSDFQLRWQPEEYAGIEIIRIMPNKAWRPDIVLYNNADGKYEVSYVSNVLVSHDGSINWVPPAIYKSTCTIDVEYFPFDEQTCEMTFGSWTFNAREIIFAWVPGGENCLVQLKDYVTSGVWDVMNAHGKVVKGEGDQAKAYVVYDLRIRRKTLFYTVNLIIPCVLISFLTVCVFYLPVVEGEKVTMSISILLALVVFLLLVSKILPATSTSIPLISRYLLFTFILNIFAILTTIVIINLNFRTPRTHQMPRWIAAIFLNLLPKLLLMRRAQHVVQAEFQKRLQAELQRQKTVFANRSACDRPLLHANSSASDSDFPPPPSAVNSASHCKPATASSSPTACTARRSVSANVNVNVLVNSSLQHQSESFTFGRCEGNELFVNDACLPFATPASALSLRLRGARKTRFSSKFAALHQELNETIDAVDFMVQHLEDENEYNRILEDWKIVAAVIDRVQLILFLLVTAVGTVSFFLRAPHIFEFVDQQQIIERLRNTNKTIFCDGSIRL